MFEKCGIKDIFYAMRKNIKFIALVTCVFLVLGIGLSVFSTNNDTVADIGAENDEWVSSACYLVKYREKPANETTEEVLNAEQMVAKTILSLLKADFTREKIYNKLLESYSKADIIEAFDLECSEEKLNAFELNKALQGEVLNSTSIINVYIQSTNKQLSKDYLSLAEKAINDIALSVKDVEVNYVDGVLNTINSDKKDQQEKYELSFTKFWLIMPIIGFILSVLFVLAKAMFLPTVNRRSDFCAYDMPVIAEMRGKYNAKNCKTSESLQFNAMRMLDYLKENNIKKCTVVTTLKNTKYVNALLNDVSAVLQEQGESVGVVNSVSELENAKYENAFVFAADMCKDVNVLKTCKQTDGVLFFEEYGKTNHNNIYETVEVLKISNIKTLGVFAVK